VRWLAKGWLAKGCAWRRLPLLWQVSEGHNHYHTTSDGQVVVHPGSMFNPMWARLQVSQSRALSCMSRAPPIC
jgi:hypothetical protein